MDCSYIEEESIHVMIPYASEPRWSLNLACDNIDEGEHQISRPFESNCIDESECHHQYIPYWRIMPSKNPIIHRSRPNTFIISTPLKKHLLDESSCIEEEDNDNLALSYIFDSYGKIGLYLCGKYRWEPPFEPKVIEEIKTSPNSFIKCISCCKDYIAREHTMLNKIIIDLCVEFWKNKDYGELKTWVKIAKEFYMLRNKPIQTNFTYKGILHFENRGEYLEYFENVEVIAEFE
jgi:hypothetical protein